MNSQVSTTFRNVISTCIHQISITHTKILKNVWIIRKLFIFSQVSRKKKCLAKCKVCGKKEKLFACISCVHVCCQVHMDIHAAQCRHTHFVDTTYGQLYCQMCSDFVYTSEYALQNTLDPICQLEAGSESLALGGRDKKAQKYIGLCGILNLYNTCFASCVVQSFLHIPFLRNFFLSGTFTCCGQSREDCFSCVTAALFQKAYDGSNDAISLGDYLGFIWRDNPRFANSSQQDAHEFYISVMDKWHESFFIRSRAQVPAIKGSHDCDCLVHVAFFGTLTSEISCTGCRMIMSTTVESFCDLSLDIGIEKKTENIINGLIDGKSEVSVVRLEGCIKRFTSKELLGPESRKMCENCRSIKDTKKSLKISKLPLVLTIHLKRFEHNKFNSLSGGTAVKLATYVQFSKKLDVRPYLSKSQQSTNEDTIYSLCCVINHIGNMAGGHYTTHVRGLNKLWYRCDDTDVYRVNEDEVFNSQAYLLFYQKDIINFS